MTHLSFKNMYMRKDVSTNIAVLVALPFAQDSTISAELPWWLRWCNIAHQVKTIHVRESDGIGEDEVIIIIHFMHAL